jgi:hypothetical protein
MMRFAVVTGRLIRKFDRTNLELCLGHLWPLVRVRQERITNLDRASLLCELLQELVVYALLNKNTGTCRTILAVVEANRDKCLV